MRVTQYLNSFREIIAHAHCLVDEKNACYMHVPHAYITCFAMVIKSKQCNFMIFNIVNIKLNLFLKYTPHFALAAIIILFPGHEKGFIVQYMLHGR
jgi:hypothetical protein